MARGRRLAIGPECHETHNAGVTLPCLSMSTVDLERGVPGEIPNLLREVSEVIQLLVTITNTITARIANATTTMSHIHSTSLSRRTFSLGARTSRWGPSFERGFSLSA